MLRSFGRLSRLSPMEINLPKIVGMGMGTSAEWSATNGRIFVFPHISSMEMKVTVRIDIPYNLKVQHKIIM